MATLSLTTDDAALQRGLQGAQNLAVGAVAAIGATLAGIGAAVVKTGFEFNSMKQQAMIGFETMLGGAQEAKDFMDELADFAKATPFEFPGLIKSSQKLLAFGFTADKVRPMLTAIGDAVSGLGGGTAEIDRVTMALGQMQAKGKVSAEEMMQLAELGIPAWDMLANKIGVDIPTAMDMASKGSIKADVAIDALVAGMSDKFGGLMAKQSRSWAGLWSTIQDTAMQTAGLLTGPVFDKASDLMAGIADRLASPEVEAGLNAISASIGALLGLLTEGDPEQRIGFFNTLAAVVGGDTAEKIALITSGIIGLVGGLTGAADSGERVKNALTGLVGEDLATFFTELASAVGTIIGPIAEAVGQFVGWQDVAVAVGILLASVLIPALISLVATFAPIIAVVAAVVLAVAVLRAAWENDFLGIATTLTEFWEGTGKPILGEVGTWLGENIPKAVALAKQGFEALVQFWQSFVVPAIENMIRNFQTLGTIAQQVMRGDLAGALGTFGSAVDAQKAAMTGGGGGSGFAGGTQHAPAGWAWVGEHGPELMRFSGGERVIPNAHAMSARVGTGMTNQFTTIVNGSNLTQQQLTAAINESNRKQVGDISRVLAGSY